MEEQVYLCSLYDYYKRLLTEKQQLCFEDYYFENLTMEEIADNNGISKNAVSKTLMEVKEKLEYYEKCLNLYSNRETIIDKLDEKNLKLIEDYI